jgi:hypothetical protein
MVQPPDRQFRSAASPRDRRNPGEEPAGEVDAHDRAALVAGEQAALPLYRVAGDFVLLGVAGQQAELERRVVGGSSFLASSLTCDLDRLWMPGSPR